MCALVDNGLFDSRYPIEDDGARTTAYVINRGLKEGNTYDQHVSKQKDGLGALGKHTNGSWHGVFEERG